MDDLEAISRATEPVYGPVLLVGVERQLAILHKEAKESAIRIRDSATLLQYKRERLREVTLGLGLARQLEEATVSAKTEREVRDTLEFTTNRLRAVIAETQRRRRCCRSRRRRAPASSKTARGGCRDG